MNPVDPSPRRLSEIAWTLHGAQITLAENSHGADAVSGMFGDDVLVTGFCQDSRQLTKGVLFGVRDGVRHRGSEYVRAAVEGGAAAFLVATGSQAEVTVRELKLPHLSVTALEQAFGVAAQACFGFPARQLKVLGVTGTNGKTTTVSMIRQALSNLGRNAAQLGTLGFESAGSTLSSGLTTPPPEAIAAYMALALTQGVEHFCMEVSSHAVVQQRIAGIPFAVAAFSNLTRDHLDFHGTLEAYEAAKFSFIESEHAGARVVNIDDESGARLAQRLRQQGRDVLTVSRAGDADVSLRSKRTEGRSSVLEVAFKGELHTASTTLVGDHNLENLLLASGVLFTLGLPARQIAASINVMLGARGRLSPCDTEADDIRVLVDYAHTPDALQRVIDACRPEPPARLLLVFGCGGDRDPGKRAPMGRIAGLGSALCWVTNDNPRTEAPEQIAEAIVSGIQTTSGRYSVCLDRAQAISEAVAAAESGDVVLIAGKGHEDYQLIGNQSLPFDDHLVCLAALAERRNHRSGARP